MHSINMKQFSFVILMWKAVIIFLVVSSIHCMRMSDEDMETVMREASITARETVENMTQAANSGSDSGSLTSGQQLAFFGFEDERAREIANMAAISLATTQAITTAANATVPAIRRNARVGQMFKKMLADTCFKLDLPCNLLDLYRTADGSCNNIANPLWGKSFTPELRFLPPKYDDGINSPRQTAKNGLPLPSPRKVSNTVFRDNTGPKQSPDKTVMVMAWGQFIDHDFTKTPISSAPNGDELDCCGPNAHLIPECFPIAIPWNDPHFTKKCMPFSRSTASSGLDCMPGPREQLNSITSYIDASNVYGSTQHEQFSLRSNSSGELKMKGNGLPGRPTGCVIESSPHNYCYHAGDERVNTVPSLGTTHTIFVREHNRIARQLSYINPMWTDEIVFQETRKILSAFNQQITYGEFLPVLLNEKLMRRYGLHNAPCHSDVYDETVNAATANTFGVAVFRFGHTLIPHIQGFMHDDLITVDQFNTETTFNRPFLIQTDNSKNQQYMARWMTAASAARLDRIFEKAIIDLLFVDNKGDSFDLTSLNIQRGRDHGTPGYNDWRHWCNLPRATHFGTTTGGLIHHSLDNAKRLGKVYNDVDDIDIFAGGITEEHIEGGGIGPTFACIFARQFKNFKVGDRFWYERPPPHFGGTGFTKAQLLEIKKISLAKIVCRTQGLKDIQPNVFRKPGYDNSNHMVKCDSLPDMDLTKWRVARYGEDTCKI